LKGYITGGKPQRMRIACALLLTILCAACATTPAPRPPVRPVPRVGTVPQKPTKYLKTMGGGWRIKLTDDHRALTACQYGLRVGHARPTNKTLYLRVEFENPLSASSPLFTDTKIEPWMHELAIRSPEVRGLRKGARYLIRVHIFDHPERKKEIGFHDQWMPARLNVKADGSVSF
jgi:hypothetical protein